MGKKDITVAEGEQHSFPRIKSYSINEIMEAGGMTAFANKLGKDPQRILARLQELPKDAFLTEDEVASALKILDESK